MDIDRIKWIEQAKGLGILLVVVGHIFKDNTAPALLQSVALFIFLFHMPLFFIISGYLYKAQDISVLLSKRIYSLGIPYCAFLVVVGGWYVLTSGSFSLHALVKQAELCGLGGAYLTGIFGVFWFVSCLFFSQLLYNIFYVRLGKGNPAGLPMVTGISLCAIAASLWSMYLVPSKLPLGLEIVPMAVVFYWVGHCVNHYHVLSASWTRKVVVGLSSGCILAGFWAYPSLQDSLTFDMKYSHYGLPVLGVVMAVLLSLVTIYIAQALSRFRAMGLVFAELGQASLVLMFLHQPVHFLIKDHGGNILMIVLASVLLPYAVYRALKVHPKTKSIFLGLRADKGKEIEALN